MGTLFAQVFIWQATLARPVERLGTADAAERYSRKSIIADWKTIPRFLQGWSAHCARAWPGRTAVASSKTAKRMGKSFGTDPPSVAEKTSADSGRVQKSLWGST